MDFDWIAVTAVAFLLAFGLIAIYSLSLESEAAKYANFEKQVIFLIIGGIGFLIFSLLDYRMWKSYSGIFYLLGTVLLVLVLLFGKIVKGASGWFSFGFFNFQPVELMKLFLIISLGNYFSRRQSPAIEPKQIVISFLYVLVPVFLAAKQPDMGAAMVMVAIWAGMLFLSGLKKKYMVIILLIALALPVLGWNVVLQDYQKTRISSFLNPQADPLGSGYNIIQSMVAVGSGGVWGKGLGHGSQSRLNFLPEKHTDFIFATIAEESGLIGGLIVLGLFGILFYRFKVTVDKSRDNFGQLLVGGVMVMLFFQILINVGMNLGIMPIAGLSLPLLSYGGSFLITTLITFGLVQSVWKRRLKRQRMEVEY